MAAKKIFGIFAAVLYFTFSLLMFASAIASVTHRMPVAAVIFVVAALISACVAVIRLKGKGGG